MRVNSQTETCAADADVKVPEEHRECADVSTEALGGESGVQKAFAGYSVGNPFEPRGRPQTEQKHMTGLGDDVQLEAIRPPFVKARDATLSIKHTPVVFLKSAGKVMRDWNTITSSSCAILVS